MHKLISYAAFKIGFWSGIFLFVVLNLLSYELSRHKYDTLPIKFADAGGYEMGFPFTLYVWSFGYPFNFYFVWSGLIADILIALVFSFVLGLIFKFVWSKSASRRLNLK